MAKPRSAVFKKAEVGIYHCFNQLVRRRFLFGKDDFTGKDYTYRKSQLRRECRRLARSMGIQVLDYGILDNHLHLVLKNRPDIVRTWSDREVTRRWWATCPGRKRANGKPAKPKEEELALLQEDVAEYRERLSDISWFMRLAQQRVAQPANREDGVTGRFFGKRFGCVRLKDEQAVLNCSLYVGLNWIHAGIVDRPESFQFTSLYERIRGRWSEKAEALANVDVDDDDNFDGDWLSPIYCNEQSEAYVGAQEIPPDPQDVGAGFVDEDVQLRQPEMHANGEIKETTLYNPLGASRVSERGFMPMTLRDYVRVLEQVGRRLRKDKRGRIPNALPPILQRLGIEPKKWFQEIVDELRLTPNLANQPPA